MSQVQNWSVELNAERLSAIRLLKVARYYVERPGGWRQGAFGWLPRYNYLLPGHDYGDGPNCAMGVFRRIDPEAFVKSSWSGAVVHWNDALGRTQAEVVALFDRAIDLLERGLA